MILGILQARATSSRLPGKVLKPLLGRPMMLRQLERLQRARLIDLWIVATSDDASDDGVVEACAEAGVACFRGSLADVLDRFYQAARLHRPDHVVRSTADCPLADPAILDRVIAHHVAGGFDYSSSGLERTLPDGLDAEVFRFEALEAAWRDARLPSEREHVTTYLYHHPERFRLGSLRHPVDLSALRLTVDEPADFELVTRLYEALHPADPRFGLDAVMAHLAAHPELTELNNHLEFNVGYRRSLEQDRAYLATRSEEA